MYENHVFLPEKNRHPSTLPAVFCSWLKGTLRFTRPATNQSVSSGPRFENYGNDLRETAGKP
jgi:hypothetical protein